MLTYSVIIGNRSTGTNAIPLVFMPYFPDTEESRQVISILDTNNNFFISKAKLDSIIKNNDTRRANTSAIDIVNQKYIGEKIPRRLGISNKGSSIIRSPEDIVLVDSRFSDTLRKYIDMLGSTHTSESNYRTQIVSNEIISCFKSRMAIRDIVIASAMTINMARSENISSNIEELSFPKLILTIPKYDEDLVKELVSMIAMTYGEQLRRSFAEGIDYAIERLEKMYYSPEGRSYISKTTKTELGKSSRVYRLLVDYRERYIRCRS